MHGREKWSGTTGVCIIKGNELFIEKVYSGYKCELIKGKYKQIQHIYWVGRCDVDACGTCPPNCGDSYDNCIDLDHFNNGACTQWWDEDEWVHDCWRVNHLAYHEWICP